MTEIRGLLQSDIRELKEIHEKFYKEEFEFPDFFEKFFCAFTILKDNKIICAGGVRPIAESILITNNEFSVAQRREALLEVLDASCYIAGRSGFTELHAFVQDKNWKNHLLKYNFIPCKGEALVLNLKGKNG